jgi:glycosyltransferase involved in cell wall biosynthesis
MRILLLAPHPFYEERGTPIAVDLLLRMLSRRGDHVDLLTFHVGETPSYPNVRIFRTRSLPFIRSIRPGFSVKKILCDISLVFRAMRMVREGAYDVVHAVEEAGFIGAWLSHRYGVPFVYDMDSSMPEQIVENKPLLRFLLPLMRRCEAFVVRRAVATVPVCDALATTAMRHGAKHVVVLRDISLLDVLGDTRPAGDVPARIRASSPVFMYIGNLERYQGIDLLLESFALARDDMPEAQLVIVGGKEKDIRHYSRRAASLGICEQTWFLGPRPVGAMKALFAEADILVSPRTRGFNTPMKIYSYLASGKAILATDLPTHTQVLDDTVAVLAAPDTDTFSSAMQCMANNPAQRSALAAAAEARARARHSEQAYERTVHQLYRWVEEHGCPTIPHDPVQ